MQKLIIQDIPPSNNKYMGRGTRYTQTIEYQDEKTKWEWLIKAAVGKNKPKIAFEKAVVIITYYFKDRRRRDPDNYSGKFILDGLVRARVIEDDSFNNIQLVLNGNYDKANPRTEIEIEMREVNDL